MASKLFRAVVGFGIGLGAASAACFGATEGSTVGGDLSAYENDASPTANKPPKPAYQDPPDAPPPPPPPPPAPPAPASDAAADVAVIVDAGADAFCDAAWPTTKGNPRPQSCDDPRWACVDAGQPPFCIAVDDAGACDWGAVVDTTSECVNAQWQCPPGTVSEATCN